MRESFDGGDGISYTRTDLDSVVVGKDACPEALAVADLDGDGRPDLVAIQSPGYADDARELVALHGPSGNVVWRALKHEVSDRLVISNGVVVVADASDEALHGVDARTGQVLWKTALPGEIKDDPFGEFGMTWNAPSLTDHGTHVSFGCEDGSVHILEARTGRLALSRQGTLVEPGHGIPGIVALLEGGMTHKILDLWDVANNRSILRARMQHRAPMAISPEGVLFVFYADVLPNDVPMTRAVSFNFETKNRRREVWVAPSNGQNLVSHNGLASDPRRLVALGGERLLLAGDDKELGGGILIDLNAKEVQNPPKPGSVRPISRMPPPQPGYELRALEGFPDTVVAVWQRREGWSTIAIGFDRATLEPRWFIGDAGGADTHNHTLRTDDALLLPYATTKKTESAVGAPVSWAHIDPSTGARVATYAVRELDCARMFGPYLLGHSTSFPGAPPIVWDTKRRERAL